MALPGANAERVAKWLLLRGLDGKHRVIDGFVMEHMYILQGICIQEMGEPLFDEDFHIDWSNVLQESLSIDKIGHGWRVFPQRNIAEVNTVECHMLWDDELMLMNDGLVERMHNVMNACDVVGSIRMQNMMRTPKGALAFCKRQRLETIDKELFLLDDFDPIQRILHEKAQRKGKRH